MEEKERFCIECDEPASWVRQTQSSGSHPFCARHAHEQKDFGKEDPSYFTWEECKKDESSSELQARALRTTGRTAQLSTRLNPETVQLLRQLAARDGITMAEVIERALDLYDARQ